LPEEDTAPEGDTTTVSQVPSRPRRNVGTWKDGPAIHRRLPIDDEDYDYSFASKCLDQPVAMIAQRAISANQPHPLRLSKQTLLECSLLQHTWTYNHDHHPYLLLNFHDPLHVNNVTDPRVLEAHLASSKIQ
jgi:hypothetical protein